MRGSSDALAAFFSSAMLDPRNGDSRFGPCGEKLDEIRSPRRREILDDLSHILRVLAVGDKQRVFGLDNNQVFYPDQSHKLLGTEDVVVSRVEGHDAFALGNIALFVAAQPGGHLVLVERLPGAEIVPAKL